MSATSICCLFCVPLLVACAERSTVAPSSPRPPKAVDRSMARALALVEAGDQLGASRYLEAALSEGADETEVLPILVGCQIRSGRLLAASETTERLLQLNGDESHTRQLHTLLGELSAQKNTSKDGKDDAR